MKRTVSIGIHALLDLLLLTWLAFGILESSRFRSQMSDQATPFLMIVLLAAIPVGLIVAWVAGRGESWSRASRVFMTCSRYPLVIIWAILAFVSVAFTLGRPN